MCSTCVSFCTFELMAHGVVVPRAQQVEPRSELCLSPTGGVWCFEPDGTHLSEPDLVQIYHNLSIKTFTAQFDPYFTQFFIIPKPR